MTDANYMQDIIPVHRMMTAEDWKSIKYFKPADADCSCDVCSAAGIGRHNVSIFVMQGLDNMREEYGSPIYQTSIWRCAHHWAEKKKKRPGSHNRGMSGDTRCHGSEAFDLQYLAIKHGFRRIGVSQKGDGRFIHNQVLDVVQPHRWLFSY